MLVNIRTVVSNPLEKMCPHKQQKPCNTNCCVYGCHSKKGRNPEISFHLFPPRNSNIVPVINKLNKEEQIDRRKVWELAIRTGKPVTDSMRVCSLHFRKEDYIGFGVKRKFPRLKKNAVPSLNLPSASFSKYLQKNMHSEMYSFREDRIKKYCGTEESSNKLPAELNNMLPFEGEYTSNYENSYNGIGTREKCSKNELHVEIKLEPENLMQKEPQEFHIKQEINDHDVDHDGADYVKIEELNDIIGKCHEDEQNYEIVLKCENFMETESPGFSIKCEGIDLEMEDGATPRFQDNVPILKDTEVTTFPCSLCTYKAKRKQHLKQHMLTHKHFSEVAIYSCEVCTYKAKRKEQVKQHMLHIHKKFSEVIIYSCGVCTYISKRKDQLERHILIHKRASDVTFWWYMCQVCTFKTKEEEYFRQHMLTHRDACELAMYSCEICAYKTNYKENLKRHNLIHKNPSEVTMFSCGICTYETKGKGTLKQHMLIHKDASEVIMYPCEVCTFKTKRQGDLRMHMLTHKNVSEVTAYSCTICTHITKRKDSLKRHMLIHTNASEVTIGKKS